MFRLARRLFGRFVWFGTGASVGFGGAMWIRHRIRRALARYAPEQVSADVSRSVRRVGTRAAQAFAEGRAEMHAREAQLRKELSVPGTDTRHH